MGIYKKPRPFNHIFGGDRILRAWYRGIKNAGPRKRAQGRAQDTPYHIISPYHNGIWRIFIECGKNPTRARDRKGEAQDTPYHIISPYHNGIWRIFIECGKNPTRARDRKGEAQGVLSYRKVTGIFDNPHICSLGTRYLYTYIHHVFWFMILYLYTTLKSWRVELSINTYRCFGRVFVRTPRFLGLGIC